MLTGVGSAFVDSPLYGLPTDKVDEFIANGLGARHATDIDQLIVVSMGTGTSFVRISGEKIEHIGGMAIGGGTLQGLSRLLLKTHDFRQIAAIAEKGDVTRVNLQIGDICNRPLPDLPVPNRTCRIYKEVRLQVSSFRSPRRTCPDLPCRSCRSILHRWAWAVRSSHRIFLCCRSCRSCRSIREPEFLLPELPAASEMLVRSAVHRSA